MKPKLSMCFIKWVICISITKIKHLDIVLLTDSGNGEGMCFSQFSGPLKQGSGVHKTRMPAHSPSNCGFTTAIPQPILRFDSWKFSLSFSKKIKPNTEPPSPFSLQFKRNGTV